MEATNPDSDAPNAELQAASKEIVTLRRRLGELELGRSATPAEAIEAIEALDQREEELRNRLAVLQGMFADKGPEIEIDVADELARTDPSSMIPRV